jgi:cellulose synthase/poly-beta-1,6-N-acetylglucosamine synthase-like glycosyltransferase
MGLSILLLSALVAYLLLALILARGLSLLRRQSTDEKNGQSGEEIDFTLLIAHYNDSSFIPQLLRSIEAQDYRGKYSICVVDDHSSPAHLKLVEEALALSPLSVQLRFNKLAAGKKNALEYALGKLNEAYVFQLDADVYLEGNYLSELVKSIKANDADLALALVKMRPSKKFVSHFAAFEFLSLQMSGLSLASFGRPIMANGAAMAYRAGIWLRYKNVGRSWSSGDDSFLVQAAASDKSLKIVCAPAAAVVTDAPDSLAEFIKQRIRWGAKSAAYPSHFAKRVALSVAFFNLTLVITLFCSAVFNPADIALVAVFFIFKAIIDYPLLRAFARFTKQEFLLKGYGLSALLYPFYLSFSVILIVIPKKRKWKGRQYS